MKNTIIGILVLLVLALGGYIAYDKSQLSASNSPQPEPPVSAPSALAKTTASQVAGPQEVIGKSVNGNDIVAYHFGSGSKEVLFIGGIHGGYEWNTALLGQQLVDYLKQNPSAVPASEMVTVIPVVNPDGLQKVVGKPTGDFTVADVNASQTVQVAGRFNANDVDLNRNFDCDWQSKGMWQNKSVSGGSAAFSEPETQAIKTYIDTHTPAGVVIWFSAGGGVYTSSCDTGVLPETSTLVSLYAKASGYTANMSFDAYATTGDIANWLAQKNIPAISVLLTSHDNSEWPKNLLGINAVLAHFAQ